MTNHVMQYFDTTQRTKDQRVGRAARPAEVLASEWDAYLPDGPEKSVALRKLLEAKDAACRASLALSAEDAVCEPTEDNPGCCQGGTVTEETD